MKIELIDSVKGKQLTVEELINLLQKCPKGAVVWHEGCDCWGQADRVELNSSENSILIGRCN